MPKPWSKIAIFVPLRGLGGPCRNTALTFGIEKLRRCGYLAVKKVEESEDILFVSTEYMNMALTDGKTDIRAPRDGIGRAYA